MFCGQCGEYLPETNKFCTKCGAPAASSFRGKELPDYFLIKTSLKEVNYTNHQELVTMIRHIKKDRVLVDLGSVTFIDSVGIGSLVTAAYSSGRKGQDIKLVLKGKNILKAIRALGVDNILSIYETTEEALGDWGISAN